MMLNVDCKEYKKSEVEGLLIEKLHAGRRPKFVMLVMKTLQST